MTIANKITIFRIIIIPIILIFMFLGCPLYFSESIKQQIEITENFKINLWWFLAGILFIIAAISDFVDGYIARKYHQITKFGKIFDPVADKMLVNSVFIVMTAVEIIPLWITLVIILRDILIDGMRMTLSNEKIILPAGIYGKLKTTMQLIGLSILFFVNKHWISDSENNISSWKYHVLLLAPLYFAMLFSIWSAIIYCYQTFKFLRSHQEN